MTDAADNWENLANCRGKGDIMSADEKDSPRRVAAAKAVCVGCPVFSECRAAALTPLDNGEDRYTGLVAAGLTTRERRPMLPKTLPAIRHGAAGRGGAAAHRRRGERPCRPCALAETAWNAGLHSESVDDVDVLDQAAADRRSRFQVIKGWAADDSDIVEDIPA